MADYIFFFFPEIYDENDDIEHRKTRAGDNIENESKIGIDIDVRWSIE